MSTFGRRTEDGKTAVLFLLTKTAKYCIINSSKNRVVRATSYKNGNCTGFTLSDGGTIRLENTYTVGSTGAMTAAQSGTDSVAYTYDNNRNLLTETINGTLSQINTYNKANQAISVQNKNGTLLQSLFTYTYSENGNMTAGDSGDVHYLSTLY